MEKSPERNRGCSMENKRKEYLGMVCNLYMIVVFAIVPLYMKEGYWRIGDVKYDIYRDASLVCFGISLPVAAVGAVFALIKRKWKLSRMDICMLLYAAANVISFLGSRYRSTAWSGYREWYMGLLTQLLLVCGYFLVSRCWQGGRAAVWCGQAALLAVGLLGIVNRLKIDPFGWFVGRNSMDWEYNHMLSTVGNINWLCGYLCVGVPLAVAGYLQAERKWERIFLYASSLAGTLLLFIQGSDSGLLAFAAGGALLLVYAAGKQEYVRRVEWLLAGLLISFLGMTVGIRIRDSRYCFPYEDKSHVIMSWWWIWIPILLLLLRSLYRRKAAGFALLGKFRRQAFVFMCCMISAGVLLGMILLLMGKIEYTWGSGRGGLWTLALYSFQKGDWWQKLFGVGPDCYAEYVYTHFDTSKYIQQLGRWANSIFTNAHNEWLNQLVNTGLTGLAAYMGIFAAGFLRYGRRCEKESFFYLGVMALAMYFVNSMVSFQQVLNAPMLFLILGMCENRCRNRQNED